MEKLISYQTRLLTQVKSNFFRFLYERLPWEQRFIGIKGPRGSGKTTMLLQYLKYQLKDTGKHLYVTLDHPYFYEHNLPDLVDDFYNQGGQTLLLDEIHKYPNWSATLKHLYDGYPDLQVIFTSSSALDLYRGEADLSRRVINFELPGLSFREFLELGYGLKFTAFTLEQVIDDPLSTSRSITQQIKPLEYWKAYLEYGHFPFFVTRDQTIYHQQLYQAIETTLLQDISFIEGFSVSNVQKMQNLLGILAETAPFEPNILKLAERLQIGRNTVKEYIFLLGKAKILNLLSRQGKGISRLQKPDKIYLENTNFSHALKEKPDEGNLRETFFLNQMTNAGHQLLYPGKAPDFVTAEGIAFEIGGKNKKTVKNAKTYTVKDDIETGYGQTIPLWLFGFLY